MDPVTTTNQHAIQTAVSTVMSIVGIAGVLLGIGAFIQRVKSVLSRLSKVEKAISEMTTKTEKAFVDMRHEMNKKLYDDDSQPLYVPQGSCRDCRQTCDSQRSREYREVKERLDMLIKLHLSNDPHIPSRKASGR